MTIKSTYLALIAGATMLLAGCSRDAEPVTPDKKGEAVTLRMKVSTRAHAADGSPITYPTDSIIGEQHTTTAYIYVFEGRGNDATYTGFFANVGWSEYFELHPDPTTHGLPVHTAEMNYKFAYRFTAGGYYTLLGVAVNDAAKATFNCPMTFEKGATLRFTKATIAAQSLTSQIRNSEIYVGTRELLYEEDQHVLPEVEMSRRVAGVMGYFKNVPDKIFINDTLRTVKEVRLTLYTRQNTSLPLIEQRQTPFFEDFVFSPSQADEGEVLFSLPVPANIDSKSIVSGGGYVLPAEAPKKGIYTMHVDLAGESGILKSIRVKLPDGDSLDQGETGGGTGIIDSESAFRFPIVANHFYALGQLSAPIDLKGNGSDIVITIDKDWTENNDLEVDERP